MQSVRHRSEFRDFAHAIKAQVDESLPRWFAPRLERAQSLGPDAQRVAEAAAAIATRGGKRFRATLLALASEGCGGPTGDALRPALLAVELFHAYLLMHDDWMDEDDVRRGGPTAHARLREITGSARAGEVGAILAGDLGAGYALEALAETQVEPARLAAAMKELAKTWVDVVLGQVLDVGGHANDLRAMETMHELKTSSYSVRGPLMLGAILGGREDLRAPLEAFSRPLGIAFQVRDDLLGTFGDPAKTGKPFGSDLAQGKRTALVMDVLASGDAKGIELLKQVLGVREAKPAEVTLLLDYLVSSGARERVEVRLTALLDESRSALERVEWSERALGLLGGAITVLGERDR